MLRLAELNVILLPVRAVTVVPIQNLARATSRHTTVHAPRLDHPSIIVDADITFTEPAIKRALSISAAIISCSARVGQSFIRFDDDWKVEFDIFSGYRFDGWKKAVAIWSVANRTSRYATETNLVEQVEFAVGFEARVEEMWRVGEACCASVCGVSLAEECLHHVHYATEQMCSTTDCCWSYRAQNSTCWDLDVDEVVKSVIDDGVRIVDGQQVVALEQG